VRKSQRLLLVYNIPEYFMMRGLRTAIAARAEGFEVHVATPEGPVTERIRSAGLDFHAISMSRSGLSPRSEIACLADLIRLYRRLKPDLVHHSTIKPVVYGGIAARLTGVPAVVHAIHGLGYVFTARGARVGFLRRGVKFALRRAFGHRHERITFLNREDSEAFVESGILAERDAIVVCPMGVDVSVFRASQEPAPPPVVILPARLLWDKGVGEFVAAARILKARRTVARFVLVGDADPGNPMTVPVRQIRAWAEEGVVECWGWIEDMAAVYAQSHIVCLPSYREGLGMVLVEGGACGRPLVATDVAGCREVVSHGENGLLVPPRNPEALADAIGTLIGDSSLRARMGARGREIVTQKFSEEQVVRETLILYRELLGRK
jgi:glycosyltransferase involved in cell wall biosynthesis